MNASVALWMEFGQQPRNQARIGYPGHGDPAHVGANAHLHLSWQHTPAEPGSPAARVQTLLSPPGEQHP
jgi:hypothetical protein